MRQEYPEQWPDAMQALLRNLEAGEDVVWMFIRVLRAVDVEIINVECHRGPADAGVAMRVKDAMRAQCLTDVARVMLRAVAGPSRGVCRRRLHHTSLWSGRAHLRLAEASLVGSGHGARGQKGDAARPGS